MDEALKALENKNEKDKKAKIPYHPAFICGLQIALYEYKPYLEYDPEHPLSQEPQVIDCLVLKKVQGVQINKTIAANFREQNVIEYKGCGDELNMRTLFKTVGYASMYYALQRKEAPVPLDSLTACIFRNEFPRELFQELEKKGVILEKKNPGIYLIDHRTFLFPVQIVIIRELPYSEEYAALRLLTKKPQEKDIQDFLNGVLTHKEDTEYQTLAHTIADTAYRENKELFVKVVKGAETMTGTILDLVEDQVQEQVKKREDEIKSKLQLEIQKRDNTITEQTGKLQAQSSQLQAQSSQLQAQSSQLQAQSSQLQAQSSQLQAQDTIIQEQRDQLKKQKLEIRLLKEQIEALLHSSNNGR